MTNDCKELFDIDRQFSLESQTDGYKAWDKYLSEDVIFGGDPKDPYTIGKKKIVSSLMNFYQLKDLKFTWEPIHGFISDDKTLGLTTGTYDRTYILNNEVINRKGKYTTAWKKIEGDWKIVLDIGN